MKRPVRTTLRLLSVAALVIAATQAEAKPTKKPAKVEAAAEEVTEPMAAKLVVGGDSSLVASNGAVSAGADTAAFKKGLDSDSATAATTDTAAQATSGKNADALAGADGAVDPAFMNAGATDADNAKAAAEAAKAAQAKLPEDQIPVLQNKKDAKQAGGSGFFRIFMTLGVLAVACGSAAFGLNRWAKKSGNAKNQKNTRIKVLTSHHLGPKKNLTIVQVAGETILLGVTDQNITMLKTLSLLDDEIPEALPQKFDHSMEDFIEEDADQDDEPIAMRGLSEIRDTVSSRLKNMRNL